MSNASGNPFDFSKLFGGHDPKTYWEQMQSAMQAFQLPAAVNSNLMASQKKSIDTLVGANQAAIAGLQEMIQRQSEMLRLVVMAATEVAGNTVGVQDAQAVAKKQAELVQLACDKALKVSTEISDLVKKNQAELSEMTNRRMDEGLKEIKDALDQAK